MTAAEFYRAVMAASADKRQEVQRAPAAVFHALRDRLTPQEADQLAAQVPRELKTVWHEGECVRRRPVIARQTRDLRPHGSR